jgi:hypothetical protein
MSKAETQSSRLPRGTKPVAKAFFDALDSVSEAQQATVARAALALIREELKTRQAKVKSATSGRRAASKRSSTKAAAD